MKILISLLAALFLGLTAQAQDFPIKPIKIVVPYSPGGGTDTVARLMAAHISNTLGQQVIVENKAGASANIGTEFVAKAPADGYTILVTAPNFTTSEALFDKLGWRFDDFIPLIHLVRYGNFLVAAPGTPFTSLEQMIARAVNTEALCRLARLAQGPTLTWPWSCSLSEQPSTCHIFPTKVLAP